MLWWLFFQSFLAATVIPLGSEPLLLYVLSSSNLHFEAVVVATIGNTLGGMSGYILGRLGKWAWLEKAFRMKQGQVTRWKTLSKKYGVWLSLLTWLPIIGDPITVALGFFRSRWWAVLLLMSVAKGARYLIVYWLWLQA